MPSKKPPAKKATPFKVPQGHKSAKALPDYPAGSRAERAYSRTIDHLNSPIPARRSSGAPKQKKPGRNGPR